MVHSGYESTAVMDAVRRPWHIMKVALFGPETEKPMAPEISLKNQRPAEYRYEEQVHAQVQNIEAQKPARAPRASASIVLRRPRLKKNQRQLPESYAEPRDAAERFVKSGQGLNGSGLSPSSGAGCIRVTGVMSRPQQA